MFASGTRPQIGLGSNPWQTLRMRWRSLDNPRESLPNTLPRLTRALRRFRQRQPFLPLPLPSLPFPCSWAGPSCTGAGTVAVPP
jgi:hypothetical protein